MNYLLTECRDCGEILTNLKLQKLLYYAQAWHLALEDEPLFDGEFQAWVHGPVNPDTYHQFKGFRWTGITTEVEKPELPEKVKTFLDEIIDVFGSETAVSLELMTHEEDPWLDARGDLDPTEPSNAVIPEDDMKRYYRHLNKDG